MPLLAFQGDTARQPSKWRPEKKCKLSPTFTTGFASLILSISSTTDPLVSHRQHFGRTVFALCNYPSLLTNGILRLEQMEDTPLENFPADHEEILHVGELIGKGAAGARGDDTKTLKSAVLDWITPKGEAIQPPLHRNSKVDRGFNHELTGFLLWDWIGTTYSTTKMNLRSGELWVCGDQWPIFLYAHYTYNTEDPWSGLLRSRLLVYAYKHVFTSPSSVEKEPKATRSGNACLHGMTSVTIASIAYIATQVRFALSSSSVFSRTDMTTDSETFYHSLLDLLKDPEESKEVHELLTWWNRQIFPTSSAAKRPISANSALSKIRQRHLALKQSSISNVATS
ncbi:uncharacterized protein F5147DRAFT_746330 [Suillus discolor]|uniref:Uncharacterized protein n=1 Tax=Suillus discolor TaxID=1912936 RepID=A0A9P7JT45_9AGAM|nr:uncharacterized protein F5147DRAFT_746330 [Suillus discolor]KAG2106183.1 hypothetical protein F5147DRAFT_746330 [Suillus discolor]